MKRTFYSDCHVEVEAHGDAEAFECDDGEVWVEGDVMLISYFDDDGIVVLEGKTDITAGWVLDARSRPRRAILKADPETEAVLAGWIEEQGERAGWRIRLGPVTDEVPNEEKGE